MDKSQSKFASPTSTSSNSANIITREPQYDARNSSITEDVGRAYTGMKRLFIDRFNSKSQDTTGQHTSPFNANTSAISNGDNSIRDDSPESFVALELKRSL
jgi:hypothetical protein